MKMISSILGHFEIISTQNCVTPKRFNNVISPSKKVLKLNLLTTPPDLRVGEDDFISFRSF